MMKPHVVDILEGDFMRSILSPILSYAGIIFSALSMPLFLSRYAEAYSRVLFEEDCTVGLVEYHNLHMRVVKEMQC